MSCQNFELVCLLMSVQFHAYIHNITNTGFGYPYMDLYTFATVSYQWFSILGSISVKDVRYIYLFACDICSAEIHIKYKLILIHSVNSWYRCPSILAVLHKNSYIGNTCFWQLPAICKYKDIKITNILQIDPILPKNSLGYRTARLIPS